MKYPKHLSPDQHLLRLTYVQVLSMAKPIGEYATWLITGVAVILGAVVVNVEAVSKIVSATSLRWGLASLVMSLLAGVITKQISFAISAGLAVGQEMYGELESPNGAAAMKGILATPEQFMQEYLSAFLPPLRQIMKRMVSQDKLAAEKRFIKFWCIQLYAMWAQGISGAAGLLILAFGIR